MPVASGPGASTAPPPTELPEYGWKLHVSSRPESLRQVLDAVVDEYLVAPFSFKCVRSPELALAQLSRWWPRGGAGKALTVYPASPEHARELADRLSARLAGYRGAHVLTDRRYPGSDVLQYRYGTFRTPVGVDDEGRASSVVTGPDGRPWSDSRTPSFVLPPWIDEDPFTDGRNATGDPTGLLSRYRVTAVLRHSTAGGVYLATGPDGAEYVLKEARPHTAFAPDGSDAVERLRREHSYLQRLDGTGVAPTAVELATVWKHTFLVQSKVPGITFQVWLARNHPFAQGLTDPTAVTAYRSRAGEIVAQLRQALTTCLGHGIVYGDTSLTNILVDHSDVARLVDFESCRPAGSDPASYQRTSGFAPEPGSPAWHSDEEYVRFAADAVEAATVMPRNALLAFRPEVFGRALELTAAQLGVELGDLPARLCAAPEATWYDDPGDLLPAIVRGLRGAATPGRDDRLFPGHPEQFRTNALSVAYGAAGVLRVLRHVAGEVDPVYLDWLLRRLDETPVLPVGLYVGRAGIASTLLELGADERGRDLLAASGQEAMQGERPAGVATGLAGVGLALLHAHRMTGEQQWIAGAGRVADRLVEQASDDGTGLWWSVPSSGHPLGYLHGSSGVAVFLTELGSATGEERLLKVGRRALAFDLARGRVRANGGTGFGAYVDGRAFEPYLIRGGAGVGMAVARHLALTGDESLVQPLRSILRGVAMPQTVNPGLFSGMSGLVEFLLDCKAVLPHETFIDVAVQRLVDQIVALRCTGPDGIGFPGDGLLRQSCDLASGSAGVAMVLHRVQTGGETIDVRYGRPLGVLSHAG